MVHVYLLLLVLKAIGIYLQDLVVSWRSWTEVKSTYPNRFSTERQILSPAFDMHTEWISARKTVYYNYETIHLLYLYTELSLTEHTMYIYTVTAYLCRHMDLILTLVADSYCILVGSFSLLPLGGGGGGRERERERERAIKARHY